MPMHESGLFWYDHMTREQKEGGGVWVIGNNPYDTNPNYPGKNDGQFLVKSWWATAAKYSRNYEPKDRVKEGQWEYVRTLDGQLNCLLTNNGIRYNFALNYPNDGIDIPPDTKRAWQLLPQFHHAAGITILRTLYKPPEKIGCGLGYEFSVWDNLTVWCHGMPWPLSGRNFRFNSARWQYLEVFQGSIYLSSSKWSNETFRAGSRLFVLPNEDIAWLPSSRAYGISLLLE